MANKEDHNVFIKSLVGVEPLKKNNKIITYDLSPTYMGLNKNTFVKINEGFKNLNHTKIEIFRNTLKKPTLFNNDNSRLM